MSIETLQFLEAQKSKATLLPLDYGHKDSIISEAYIQNWCRDLQIYIEKNPDGIDKDITEFVIQGKLNTSALIERYKQELRLLSRENVRETLIAFGTEITEKFTPEKSLFYIPPESESAVLFLRLMGKLVPDIKKFGIVHDGYHQLTLRTKNDYTLSSVNDAEAYIYVDDWILSGEHFLNFLTKDVADRFYTYHAVVSTQGQKILEKASDYVKPRYMYTAPSATGFYPNVAVYGFHKIPDRLPQYYAPFSRFPQYSIFGKNADGEIIGKGTRLTDHKTFIEI